MWVCDLFCRRSFVSLSGLVETGDKCEHCRSYGNECVRLKLSRYKEHPSIVKIGYCGGEFANFVTW